MFRDGACAGPRDGTRSGPCLALHQNAGSTPKEAGSSAPGEAWSDTTQEGRAPPAGLRERDWDILREIARTADGRVGFQGLRRGLELHPEALRRALARLVDGGLVDRSELGYALTDKGHGLFATRPVPSSRHDVHPVAFLLLPSHLDPEAVAAAFTRRWFDGLHWYGLVQGSGESILAWRTEDGVPVRLRVGPWGARVETAIREDGVDAGIAAAAPIVAALAAFVRVERPAAA